MRTAVTGGTGFVGRNLVNRLLKDNHEVAVLTHNRLAGDLFDDKVHLVHGSVDKAEEMVPVFQGASVVFHLVGIIAETRSKTFHKTVTQGTKNVVTACKEAGVRKLIYLSALGTGPDAPGDYFQSKYAAEQFVKESGLSWTILRSSIIYGKGDGFLTLLSKLIRLSPIVPIFGDGKYKMQPVYIDDMTTALVKSAELTDANEMTIEVGGPEQLEYEIMLNQIKNSLKKKRLNLHIPFAVIKTVAALLEMIIKPAPLTRNQLVMLKMGSTGEISTMKKLFGIEPVKFQDGLKLVFGE